MVDWPAKNNFMSLCMSNPIMVSKIRNKRQVRNTIKNNSYHDLSQFYNNYSIKKLVQFRPVASTTTAPRTLYPVTTNTSWRVVNVFTTEETGFEFIDFLQFSFKFPVSLQRMDNLRVVLVCFENFFFKY